jgi:SAM-dependent methyltransferase
MNLITKSRNVLRALKQRWGTPKTKSQLWDREYQDGRWNHCARTPGAWVYSCMEKYCDGGTILDVGCGSGNTGNELKAGSYQSYLGIDISEVAVARALERSHKEGRGGKNHYLTGDIVSFIPSQKHDVILFRESIYYVPLGSLKTVLKRYCQYLSPDGVVLVDVSATGTHKGDKIRRIIEANFDVVERCSVSGSGDFILVFR